MINNGVEWLPDLSELEIRILLRLLGGIVGYYIKAHTLLVLDSREQNRLDFAMRLEGQTV